MEHYLFSTLAYLITIIVIHLVDLFPLAVALVIIERFLGRVCRSWKARGVRTDLGYLILSALYGPLAHYFLALLVVLFALPASLVDGWAPPWALWPLTVQVLLFLLLRDALIFARHWLFHSRILWPFHAVHHSSPEVNWLSAARFHPAESIIEAFLDVALMVCLSLDQSALVVASALVGFNNFFIHSECLVTYGPLRWVLVSPVFHRWHHSIEKAALNKNFAAMFSFLDLLCGTFYMPEGRLPAKTGISGPRQVPETLWGQLTYPFTRGG